MNRLNAILPHQALDTVLAAALAGLPQIDKDAASSIDAVARLVGGLYQPK